MEENALFAIGAVRGQTPVYPLAIRIQKEEPGKDTSGGHSHQDRVGYGIQLKAENALQKYRKRVTEEKGGVEGGVNYYIPSQRDRIPA